MKTRTMYMHTLDRQPASYQVDGLGWPSIYFVGGRNKVKLVESLAALRQQQRFVLEHETPESEWKDARRYGYVLVEVPQ